MIYAFSQSTSIYRAGEGVAWCSLDKEADKTDMAPDLIGHQNSGGGNHFVKNVRKNESVNRVAESRSAPTRRILEGAR